MQSGDGCPLWLGEPSAGFVGPGAPAWGKADLHLAWRSQDVPLWASLGSSPATQENRSPSHNVSAVLNTRGTRAPPSGPNWRDQRPRNQHVQQRSPR